MRNAPPSQAHVVYERRLVAAPASLSRVRHEVAGALEHEGASRRTVQDALLVLSELGTNAMHATGYGREVCVRLAMEPTGDVVVEVQDEGGGFRLSQSLRLPDEDDEHGRGLSIVCLVADETIVRRRRRRTIVRALIRSKRSA